MLLVGVRYGTLSAFVVVVVIVAFVKGRPLLSFSLLSPKKVLRPANPQTQCFVQKLTAFKHVQPFATVQGPSWMQGSKGAWTVFFSWSFRRCPESLGAPWREDDFWPGLEVLAVRVIWRDVEGVTLWHFRHFFTRVSEVERKVATAEVEPFRAR